MKWFKERATPGSGKRLVENADRFRWEFTWEQHILARSEECSTYAFAQWLLIEGTAARFPRRALISRYAEFVELTGTRPITGWHRFDLSLKPAGIHRVRSGKGVRPWVYRVQPAEEKSTARPRCYACGSVRN
jgi:hypothetical protein